MVKHFSPHSVLKRSNAFASESVQVDLQLLQRRSEDIRGLIRIKTVLSRTVKILKTHRWKISP